jgi:hypothetical protein
VGTDVEITPIPGEITIISSLKKTIIKLGDEAIASRI